MTDAPLNRADEEDDLAVRSAKEHPMTDSNGKAAPIPPADTRGGVNLAASILRNAVGGILEARMAEPMPLAPTFRQSVGVNMPDGRGLTPDDVEFVRAQYEQKWWLITAQVRNLGLDEKRDGAFSLVEVGYGQRQDNGNLFAEFVLVWTPNAAEGVAPISQPLSIVAP